MPGIFSHCGIHATFRQKQANQKSKQVDDFEADTVQHFLSGGRGNDICEQKNYLTEERKTAEHL